LTDTTRGWLTEEDTPVAVARINPSHLRASILRQTDATAAVVAVAFAAPAADVGISFAATSHWWFQLAEADSEELAVVVAVDGVELVGREGLERNCRGR
jgi:hypothetical protein